VALSDWFVLMQSLPANAQHCSVKVIDFGFCEEVQPGQLLERFSGSEAYVAPGAFLPHMNLVPLSLYLSDFACCCAQKFWMVSPTKAFRSTCGRSASCCTFCCGDDFLSVPLTSRRTTTKVHAFPYFSYLPHM
jgi:hypothetical protein